MANRKYYIHQTKTDCAGMFLNVNLARFDLNTQRKESETIHTSISTMNDLGLITYLKRVRKMMQFRSIRAKSMQFRSIWPKLPFKLIWAGVRARWCSLGPILEERKMMQFRSIRTKSVYQNKSSGLGDSNRLDLNCVYLRGFPTCPHGASSRQSRSRWSSCAR